MANNYIDVTEKWLKEAKPKKGYIKFLSYSITQDGERFDSFNSILDINYDEDYYIGNWFRNTIWGNTRIQPAIVFPHKKRSADLRLFGKCPLIEEQTIEIKIIGSKRRDGLIKRFKQAKNQSSNVLIDVTDYPFPLIVVEEEVKKYYLSHDWVKVIIVKKENDLLFVWEKK